MSELKNSNIRPFGLSLITLSLALAACNPKVNTEVSPSPAALGSSESALPPLPDVQPMVTGPAAPVRMGPKASALPKSRTLGYASVQGNDRYAWIDRANRINETIGDAPPDYGFDYQDGVEPYGWESAGGYRTYAEPVDGGYRYYYYDPGANEPYLVRDPAYSYGYSGGRIAAIYDRGGRALDGYQTPQQADYAARYYARARAMRAAADRRQRRSVVASGWAERRAAIGAQRAEWSRTPTNNVEWRAYRDDHAVEDQQLADERTARAQAARQFSTWQAHGFRGQAAGRYGQQQGGRGSDNGGSGPREQVQQAQAQQAPAKVRQQNQQLVRQEQGQKQAAKQRALQMEQQQLTRDAAAKARDQVLRQQRDAGAKQQGAAQLALRLQQRAAMTKARARKSGQEQVARAAADEERAAAQTKRQRDVRQRQVTAQQKPAPAAAEAQRAARERPMAVKQPAGPQRTNVQRGREAHATSRTAMTRQNAAEAGRARAAVQPQQAPAAGRQEIAKPFARVLQPKPPELQKPGTLQRLIPVQARAVGMTNSPPGLPGLTGKCLKGPPPSAPDPDPRSHRPGLRAPH